MRCERCKFENIPSQKACIKCGSILEIKHTALNVYPPRASSWKKSFRILLRWIRRGKTVPHPHITLNVPPKLKAIFLDSFIGMVLSIVPGLAHLLQNRFREIRWYFLAWLLLLLSGLFLYGSEIGFVCLGLAVGAHAGIALQYGILKELSKVTNKIVAVILVFIGLMLVYRFIPRIFIPDLTGGFSSLTVPYHKVEAGDYLLAWGDLDQKNLLPRGSLVLIHPATFSSYRERVTMGEVEIIGQVVGFPEEHLEIQDALFIINGQHLDEEKFPVPRWLHGVDFSVTIPENSYFVSAQYNIRAHGIKLGPSHILHVCLVHLDNIEARAFMRWLPLSRRGFLR